MDALGRSAVLQRPSGWACASAYKTLSLGVCHPIGRITRPDTDALIEAVFGRTVDKTEEGTWVSEERSA